MRMCSETWARAHTYTYTHTHTHLTLLHPADATFCYNFFFVIYDWHFQCVKITEILKVGKTEEIYAYTEGKY